MTDNEKLDRILSEIQGMKTDVQELKFDVRVLKTEMQEVKTDVQELKSDVQVLKTDMQEVKTDVQKLKSDVQVLKTDMQELKSDVQVLKAEMQEVKIDMLMHRREAAEMKAETEIYRAGVEAKFERLMLHLENVTDRNIRIIAEGHADLNRKLDEALKIENEKEVFKVRLNYLEGEMAEVKEWISRFEKTA